MGWQPHRAARHLESGSLTVKPHAARRVHTMHAAHGKRDEVMMHDGIKPRHVHSI